MTTNFYAGDADAAEVVRAVEERDVGLLVVNEITFGTLDQMEEAGIDDLLPYRIGEPNGAVDGTMVFSREPLGEAIRLDDGLPVLAGHRGRGRRRHHAARRAPHRAGAARRGGDLAGRARAAARRRRRSPTPTWSWAT